MSNLIEVREGGGVTLTMNRPDAMNVLSNGLIDELVEALAVLGHDPDVEAIVLTWPGCAFCAGGDVQNLSGRAGGTLEEKIGDCATSTGWRWRCIDAKVDLRRRQRCRDGGQGSAWRGWRISES